MKNKIWLTLPPRLLALLAILFAGNSFQLKACSADPAPLKLFSSEIPASPNEDIVTYDFGRKDLMSQELVAEPKEPAFSGMAGIIHIFKLENRSAKDITIDDSYGNPPCVSIGYLSSERTFRDFPCVVPAFGKVSIVVSLDPNIVYPGKLEVSIPLKSKLQKSPLITLRMKGYLESGISLLPARINFGSIDAQTEPTKLVTLSIDKRIQSNIGTDRLQLISTNPYVEISSVSARQVNMGVKVQGNEITLPHVLGDDLPHDLKLTFRVKVRGTAPIGAMSGEIKLVAPQLPMTTLIQSTRSWFSAETKGHMKADVLSPILFDSKYPNEPLKRTVNISYAAPVTPDSLKVISSNKYMTAALVTPARPLLGTTKETHQTAQLEVTLSPNTPIGQQNGRITLMNTVNKERIELLTHATVVK